jgi:hypothetical protein
VGIKDRIGLVSSFLYASFLLAAVFVLVFLRKCLSVKGKRA